MIRRMVGLAGISCLALCAALTLSGCSLFTTTLNDNDHGSIQRLNVGDLLVIRLSGNVSTGYEWVRVEPASLEGAAIEVVQESDYQALGIEPIGSPGVYVFRYRALRPGTVAMKFEYRRPWDVGDVSGDYAVTIWVQ